MRTVVITGGSSGIGLAIANKYCQQGDNVVLLARDQERLNSAVIECEKAKITQTQKVLAFSVDINNKCELAQCVENIYADIGHPDIIVLSAGIIDCKCMVEQDDEIFLSILQTNVIGSRLVAKAFLPQMISNRNGQICFVASLGGLISTYGYSAYSASKFAVLGLAGAMRQELAEHNVGVNVVCPGEVDTPMTTHEAEYILPQTRFIKDLGGTMQAQDVAIAVLKGVENNRFIIIPGFKGKASYWFSRVFPRSFATIMQLVVRFSSR